MADIILDRHRDLLANISHYPGPWHSFAASSSEGRNCFFSRSFSVFVNFLSPVLNIFSTSVSSKFLDLERKWHHKPNDSTDIIFRLTLSVLPFISV